MSDAPVLLPTAEAATALVREARANGTILRPVGGGSRPLFGMPRGLAVRVEAEAGTWLHHPEDLLVTVPAGMTVAEMARRLAVEGQALPLAAPEGGTVGGLVAQGTGDPCLHGRNLPRAWVLGSDVILGNGEPQRIGARVVKNVAGYDAARLWCGSRGTLGLLLSVTFKVAPLPGAWCGHRESGVTAEALARALVPWQRITLTWLRVVSGTLAAHDPDPWQPAASVPWREALCWTLLAGLEGTAPVVEAVARGWPSGGQAPESRPWRYRPLGATWAEGCPPQAAWSLAVLPSRVPRLLEALADWCNAHAADGRRWAYSGDPARGRLEVALWGDAEMPTPPIERWVEASGGLWQVTAGSRAGGHGPSRMDEDLQLALKRTCDPDDIMNPDTLPGCLA